MRREERFQHHYDEMVAWGSGTKSHWNTILNACAAPERRAEMWTLCAQADAAETAKHAAIVMALAISVPVQEDAAPMSDPEHYAYCKDDECPGCLPSDAALEGDAK